MSDPILLALSISTHAPAGGATSSFHRLGNTILFLLTPLREGRLSAYFQKAKNHVIFLLTPLREGRQ